jgi:hypothetical protein
LSSIRKQANQSTVVSPHGNSGKPNGRKCKDTDPMMVALQSWFIAAEQLAESPVPCGLCEKKLWRDYHPHDHDDKAVYLPMT